MREHRHNRSFARHRHALVGTWLALVVALLAGGVLRATPQVERTEESKPPRDYAALDRRLTEAEADPDRADVDGLQTQVHSLLSQTTSARQGLPEPVAMAGLLGDAGRRLHELGLKVSSPADRQALLMLALEVCDHELGLWRHDLPVADGQSAAATYLALADTYGDLGYREEQVKCYLEVVTGRFDGTTGPQDVHTAKQRLREVAPDVARRIDRGEGALLALGIIAALGVVGFVARGLYRRHIRRYYRPSERDRHTISRGPSEGQ